MNSNNNTALGSAPQMPIKKQYRLLDRRDFIFMLLSVAASFLFIRLALWNGFNLGFTVAYFALFIISTIYLFRKADAFAFTCGALSLAGAVTYSLYDNHFINVVMMLLICGLYTIYCLGISGTLSDRRGSFRLLVELAEDTLVNPFKSLPDIIGGARASSSGRKSLSGVAGAALALPVLLVIVPLLVKSDAAFEGLIKGIGKNVGLLLLQLIIAIAVSPYIFSSIYEKRAALNKKQGSPSGSHRVLNPSACSSFLGVIAAVYVVYLFSQLAYFFSAFKGILPAGYKYTASAFARRGFFEMFAICAINVLIISLTTMLSRKKSAMLKAMSCFISLFSVLLIVIAMQKMRLNISIYGLSENRVLVSAFMLMMLVVLAFFILHIFAPKISYMQPIILICSAIFIALSYADIDARIAQYNINAYESGSIATLDAEAIANLSDSAVPYLCEIMKSKDEKASHIAISRVAELRRTKFREEFISDKNNSSPWEFNYATMQAVLAIDDCDAPELLDEVVEFTSVKDAEIMYDADADMYSIYREGYWELYEDGYRYFEYDKKQGKYIETSEKVNPNKDDSVVYSSKNSL